MASSKRADSLAAPRPADHLERRRAEHVAHEFAQAMMSGDAAAASACFAAGARFLTPDRTEICGRAAIRSVLAQLAGSEVRLQILLGRVVTSGEVALATQQWRRSGKDGLERFEDSTAANLVLVRGQGGWAIAIASPWV